MSGLEGALANCLQEFGKFAVSESKAMQARLTALEQENARYKAALEEIVEKGFYSAERIARAALNQQEQP